MTPGKGQGSAVKVQTAEGQKAKEPTHYRIVIHDLRKHKAKELVLENVNVLISRSYRSVGITITDENHFYGSLFLNEITKDNKCAKAFVAPIFRRMVLSKVI